MLLAPVLLPVRVRSQRPCEGSCIRTPCNGQLWYSGQRERDLSRAQYEYQLKRLALGAEPGFGMRKRGISVPCASTCIRSPSMYLASHWPVHAGTWQRVARCEINSSVSC